MSNVARERVVMLTDRMFILFASYPKNEKEDITEDERKFLKAAMSKIDANWRNHK